MEMAGDGSEGSERDITVFLTLAGQPVPICEEKNNYCNHLNMNTNTNAN